MRSFSFHKILFCNRNSLLTETTHSIDFHFIQVDAYGRCVRLSSNSHFNRHGYCIYQKPFDSFSTCIQCAYIFHLLLFRVSKCPSQCYVDSFSHTMPICTFFFHNFFLSTSISVVLLLFMMVVVFFFHLLSCFPSFKGVRMHEIAQRLRWTVQI